MTSKADLTSTLVHFQSTILIAHRKTESDKEKMSLLRKTLTDDFRLINEKNGTLGKLNKRYVCDFNLQDLVLYYVEQITALETALKQASQVNNYF
jgi:hypothetical protein